MARMPQWGVLRLRDLRFVFGATLASQLGDGVTQVALAFAVLDLTGSASDLGIVIASKTIATVAVLLFAGVIADRSSRRLVMMGADLLRFGSQATIAVLILTHHATVAEIAVSQALIGVGSGFFDPASNGLMPAVAGDHLQEANALQGIATSVAMIGGPALGGVLVVSFGSSWALLLDAVTYGVSALLLSGVSRAAGVAHRVEGEAPGRFLDDLRHGFREIRTRNWLWAMIIAFSVANSLAGAWDVLGPLMCKRHYGGAGAFALLSTMWAVGALGGGFLLLRYKPRKPLLFGAIVCLPIGLPSVLLAIHTPLWAVVPGSLLAGIGPILFNTLWWTALQEHIPKEVISRVVAYDYAGSYALSPVGYAVAGPLAAAVGLSPAMLIFSLTGTAVIALTLLVKDVRDLSTGGPTPDIVGA